MDRDCALDGRQGALVPYRRPLPRLVMELAYYSLYVWSMGVMYLLPIPSYLSTLGLRLWAVVAKVAVAAGVVAPDWSARLERELMEVGSCFEPIEGTLHFLVHASGGEEFAERLLGACFTAATNYSPENGGWPDIRRVHKGLAPLGGPVYVDADTVRLALQDLLLSGRLEHPLVPGHGPAARPTFLGPGSSSGADPPAGTRLSIHPSLMAEPSHRDSTTSGSSYMDSIGTPSPSPRPGLAPRFQGTALAPPSEVEELPQGEEWQTGVSAFDTPEQEEEGTRRAYVVLSGDGAGEGGAARRGVSGSTGTGSMYSASDAGLDSDLGSAFSLRSRFQVLSVATGAGAGAGTSRGSSLASQRGSAGPQQPGAHDADVEEAYSEEESDGSDASSESGSDWSSGPVQMPRAKVTVSPDRSSPPAAGGLVLSPDWHDNGDTDASGETSEYGTDVSWAARSL